MLSAPSKLLLRGALGGEREEKLQPFGGKLFLMLRNGRGGKGNRILQLLARSRKLSTLRFPSENNYRKNPFQRFAVLSFISTRMHQTMELRFSFAKMFLSVIATFQADFEEKCAIKRLLLVLQKMIVHTWQTLLFPGVES
jgi:hypothetical protein